MSQRLDNLLRPIVADLGYELWHMESGAGWLRVYIDADAGIGLEDCESVSREIGDTLAVENLAYDLEVSSPGIERPLATTAHFEQFMGERVRIKLFAPVDGQRRVSGVIQSASDDAVELSAEDQHVTVAMDNIAKAYLDPVLEDDES